MTQNQPIFYSISKFKSQNNFLLVKLGLKKMITFLFKMESREYHTKVIWLVSDDQSNHFSVAFSKWSQENARDESDWLFINQWNFRIEIENKTVLFKALLIWQNVNFCYDLCLKRINLMILNQNLNFHEYAFKFDSQKRKIGTKIEILS